jgi:GTP cyclohydrolase II
MVTCPPALGLLYMLTSWSGKVVQGLFSDLSQCLSAHVFNSIECDCREQMEMAQVLIEQKGSGVTIWLDQEGRGNGHLALVRSRSLHERGLSQTEAYLTSGYEADARRHTRATEILQDYGGKIQQGHRIHFKLA